MPNDKEWCKDAETLLVAAYDGLITSIDPEDQMRWAQRYVALKSLRDLPLPDEQQSTVIEYALSLGAP